jgi:transcriptional regulator with XRE-family HTH domain
VGQLLTAHPTINSDPKIDFAPERKLQPTFIRHWRKHRGKTLSQVADVVGVSHATISRIETNSQPYSQPILEGIADALDTDAASLLSRDPSDYEAIWSIWDKARQSERELIVNVATAILRTRKGD